MKTHNRRCYLLLAAVAFNALTATQVSPGEQEIRLDRPEKKGEPMNSPTASEKVIEILTLDIKPGMRDEFHTRYMTKSVPLLKKWNFNLVAYGPSLHRSEERRVGKECRSRCA